jgi:hypothetical protein
MWLLVLLLAASGCAALIDDAILECSGIRRYDIRRSNR